MSCLKKVLYLLFAFALVLSSCKKEEEVEDKIATIQANKERCESYLIEKKEDVNVKEDPSGLLYEVITSSKGDKPGAKDTVQITYKGFLIDNRQFVEKSEKVAMEDLAEGLYIGLRHMTEGSTYKLYVPYYLMYGATPMNFYFGKDDKGKDIVINILEYSALVYEMTLESIIFVEK